MRLIARLAVIARNQSDAMNNYYSLPKSSFMYEFVGEARLHVIPAPRKTKEMLTLLFLKTMVQLWISDQL